MKPATKKLIPTGLAAWLVVFGMIALADTEAKAQAATQEFVTQLHYARAGTVEAQIFVANAFIEGRLVERDIQQAVGWYLRAAKSGNIEAQFQAAKILHSGGNGVKRQPLAATKLYKAAAKRGHPGAQNWLGYAYQHGHGVIKDYTVAADWYQNAAEQGLADAQTNLGLMHLLGNGVPQDHVKAAQLFQLAVDQGHGFAMNNLAGMYEVGWGVDRSADKAKELYLAAALKGNTSAIENLKRLGEPVPYEAQQQAALNARKSLTAPAVSPNEQPDENDVLTRDEQLGDVPTIDASDEEFEEWIALQDDLDPNSPEELSEDTDTFDVFRKNWNRVNRRRFRRPDPSDSLR